MPKLPVAVAQQSCFIYGGLKAATYPLILHYDIFGCAYLRKIVLLKLKHKWSKVLHIGQTIPIMLGAGIMPSCNKALGHYN